MAVLKSRRNKKSLQARQRMIQEVRILQVLDGTKAQVPRVLDENISDAISGDAEPYLVEEYIEGPTLRSYVEEHGSMPLDDAMRVTEALADTIQIAHDQGVVHRDLKPDNLLLRGGEPAAVTVIDFGLSTEEEADELTQVTETFKSNFIILPENTSRGGNRRDPRSDITCVAAIFYHCLTGLVVGPLRDAEERPPHRRPGGSVLPIDDPRRPRIESVLDRAFQQRVALRFQSIEELMAALSRAARREAEDDVDPETFAQERAALVRIHNRPARLEQMKQQCASFHGAMVELLKRQRPLELCGLHAVASYALGGKRIGELEVISLPIVHAILTYEFVPDGRTAFYLIAARDEQCTLLHRSFAEEIPYHALGGGASGIVNRSRQRQIDPRRRASETPAELQARILGDEADWEDVLTFVPGQGDVDHRLFSQHFNRWVTRSIAELTDPLVQPKPSENLPAF